MTVIVAGLSAAGGLTASAQEPDPVPRRYDVDREFAQGIVRDVSEGGRLLLVELRDDHELMRGADPMESDPSIALDPGSSALRADDRRDGRLRLLDLGRATGWVFIDDLAGGAPEVLALEEMSGRFRHGQIVEIGAAWDSDASAILEESFGGRGSARPDPRDLRTRGNAYQGRVDRIRIDGPIRIRVNRAFE